MRLDSEWERRRGRVGLQLQGVGLDMGWLSCNGQCWVEVGLDWFGLNWVVLSGIGVGLHGVGLDWVLTEILNGD